MRCFDPLETPLMSRSLIEASAGTGKTYAISNLYLRLLTERNLKVEEILVVTFTRAATEELKGRIRRRIVDAVQAMAGRKQDDEFLSAFAAAIGDRESARRRLNSALRSFDLAAIFTIHGFCLRMLHNHAFESGSLFDTGLVEDQTAVLREIVDDFWRKNFYPMAPDIFAGVASELARNKLLELAKKCTAAPFLVVDCDGGEPSTEASEPTEGRPRTRSKKNSKAPDGLAIPTIVAMRRQFIEYARGEAVRRKGEANVRSYDDLLVDLYRALEGPGGKELSRSIRERYKAALVDEFQDTDPLQYEIFKTIYGKTEAPLFLIGDPKQSIYGFRGADIFAYMKAVHDVDERYTLSRNWRSSGELLKAVNAIFTGSPVPFLFESLPFCPVEEGKGADKGDLTIDGKPDSAPLKMWFLERETKSKNIGKGVARTGVRLAVADEVVRLIARGVEGRAMVDGRPLHPGDIAILVPTNWEARATQETLAEARVPAVVYSTESIFTTHEALEVERLMNAILDPADDSKAKVALTTDLIGLSGNDLAQLLDREREWDLWIERLEDYRSQWVSHGFIAMAGNLITREHVKTRIRAFPDGERRLTNLLHCLEVVHRASVKEKVGMEGLVKWLREKREKEDPLEAEEYQIRLETDERAVKIVTIHKSKGLEYPIVFCPFLWGGAELTKNALVVYHDGDKGCQLTIDVGYEAKKTGRRVSETERLAENIRLLYVALTRAKYRCYVAWGSIKEAETSALSYLLHGSKDTGNEVSLEALRRHMHGLSDEAMREDLEHLAARSEDTIEVISLPKPLGLQYNPPVPETGALQWRQFSGSIEDDWHTSSFSALASGRYQLAELPDRDREYGAEHVLDEKEEALRVGRRTVFDFPRGSLAGTCLHDIFEHADFSMQDHDRVRELIHERLEAHGFDAGWSDVVEGALRNTLTVQLPGNGRPFSLCELRERDRLHEVEFYAPLERITSKGLGRIFRSRGGPPVPEKCAALIEGLGFKPVKGMLRGFIDMVFQAHGMYYLVDWKSNFLGATIEDYRRERLQEAMDRELYILQYHLYAVALHRFLRARIRDYSYGHHFGGIYYMFLRGIDPARGSDSGIFFDRPAFGFIEELTRYLTGR